MIRRLQKHIEEKGGDSLVNSSPFTSYHTSVTARRYLECVCFRGLVFTRASRTKCKHAVLCRYEDQVQARSVAQLVPGYEDQVQARSVVQLVPGYHNSFTLPAGGHHNFAGKRSALAMIGE